MPVKPALLTAALLLATLGCRRVQTPDQAAEGHVLFKAGRLHKAEPRWTTAEERQLTASGDSPRDSCQAPRDAAQVCEALAPGCVPLPLIGAWSPCYGSGALCTEIYREGQFAQYLANPPPCYCSCGPEHAAARARDERLLRDPPP